MKFSSPISQHIRALATIFGPIIFTLKLSILLQYLRIFWSGSRNSTFWVYHIVIWLNLLFYLTLTFIEIFMCNPMHKSWKPWTKGRCMDFKAVNVISGTMDSVSDISILIVPQKVIWNLSLSNEKKMGASAIFLIGTS